MKHAKIILAGAILLLAAAVPPMAMAQAPRTYEDLHLGNNFDNFLNNHPNLRAQIRANPGLLSDGRYRRAHPELQSFLDSHPAVWQKIQAGEVPVGTRGMGAYDPNHQWRNADWWHQNNPDWMYKNHPEWAENHPDWRSNDGDFDEHHEWHARQWWNDHRPDWVTKHHPDWYKHEQPQAAKEQGHQEKQQGQEAKQQGNAQKHGHHGEQGDHDHN